MDTDDTHLKHGGLFGHHHEVQSIVVVKHGDIQSKVVETRLHLYPNAVGVLELSIVIHLLQAIKVCAIAGIRIFHGVGNGAVAVSCTCDLLEALLRHSIGRALHLEMGIIDLTGRSPLEHHAATRRETIEVDQAHRQGSDRIATEDDAIDVIAGLVVGGGVIKVPVADQATRIVVVSGNGFWIHHDRINLFIGQRAVPDGDFIVIAFKLTIDIAWIGPPSHGHFCLVSRIPNIARLVSGGFLSAVDVKPHVVVRPRTIVDGSDVIPHTIGYVLAGLDEIPSS